MNKEKILWACYFVEGFFVFLSVLFTEVVFQVCVWTNMEHELSWIVLRRSEYILFSLEFIMLIITIYCKIHKISYNSALFPKKLLQAVVSFIYLSYFILFFVTGFHLKSVGHVADEYELASAHGLFLVIICVLHAAKMINVGFFRPKN